MMTNSPNQLTIPRVLVVDDEPGMRQLLRQEMEKLGYQVQEASNGKEAMEVYLAYQPDVVLLDAIMPVMDGFACCRGLMTLVSDPPPLVLMTTTLDDASSINRAFAAGATDYVTKPINWVILSQRVQRLIQQARLMQQMRQYNQDLEDYAMTRNATIRRQNSQIDKGFELESTLKRITDKVRDSLDENLILTAAVQELACTLNVNCCNAGIYHYQQRVSHIRWEHSLSTPGCLNCILAFEDFPEIYQPLLRGEAVELRGMTAGFLPVRTNLLALPIVDGYIVGDLWLLWEGDRHLDELEYRLVEQVATQCAIGIRQARLYQESQVKVQELQRLNDLKDDFLSTVSHELRTPVTNMRLAINALEQHLEKASQLPDLPLALVLCLAKSQVSLQILHTECEREISLINDLLDLQRLEAGEHALRISHVYLQDWLPTEIEAFLPRLKARQQMLNLRLPADLPPLSTDLSSVKRILSELLNNAYKYSPAGATITVSAATQDEQVQISVCNTGVEIADHELNRIFDKFYRVAAGDRWKRSGTGLGLALVKRLMQHLGGFVYATSSHDQVCVTLHFLPLAVTA